MATLDLSTAHRAFSMTDPNLVTFNRAYQADPNFWLFNTPDGHALRLTGSGLTYDAQGRATTGLVSSLTIDLRNDNSWSPDITITGINASAPRLDDGPAEFWHFLEGNDTIRGPMVSHGASAANMTLVGDGVAARSGTFGGRDVILMGDGSVFAMGDVAFVGVEGPVGPTTTYRGGNDEILGVETALTQRVSGDVGNVYAGGKLTGGHDTILIQSTNSAPVVGDALLARGTGGVLAEVIGGNDFISAGPNFRGTLVGDVLQQNAASLVRGGADTIAGGELAEIIVGDVLSMTGARLVGGNDTLSGNGGGDTIFGDGYDVDRTSTVAGGNDVIRGGRGNDTLMGDFGGIGIGAGGDDRLYGEIGDDELDGDGGDDVLDGGSGLDLLVGDDGNDSLHGGTESDILDGGSGDDLMDGGAGADDLRGGAHDDTYFVNDQLDRVIEGADAGHDTVWSSLAAYRLRGEVEDLRFNGGGSFTGIGNGLNNTIQGAAGADDLRGEGGNDVLIGGGGADRIDGGGGLDTASYANASSAVDARLMGNSIFPGNDARGDVYAGIENLTGSDFGDYLFGDDLANTLSGGAGNDDLRGNGGADALIGGGGTDDLAGGGGNDAFVFNARTEGRDRIFDFSRGAGNDDRLQFEGDAFGGLPAGALSASRFVANTSGAATTTSQRFVYETDTGLLRFDANGSAAGGVTEVALLSDTPVLTLGDFLIV